jgi:hypothetical protein
MDPFSKTVFFMVYFTMLSASCSFLISGFTAAVISVAVKQPVLEANDLTLSSAEG